jgi:predicted small secreted protein
LLHELFVRIAGVNIASLIYFLLPHAEYSDDQLTISMRLTSPATKEIISVVESGFVFRMRLYGSVIVNDHRVHRFERVQTLAYRGGVWYVNDTAVHTDSLQAALGECMAVFGGVHLGEGDRLQLYCSASILPDKDFEISTGLSTAILWNYYIPHIKLRGIVKNGRPVFEE